MAIFMHSRSACFGVSTGNRRWNILLLHRAAHLSLAALVSLQLIGTRLGTNY
jgi:hypothetical protein